MKKLIFPFISVLAVLAATGCSTKFKVDAPYKNISVVYGLLDEADTAHYIRIEKAYLDPNKSALTLAQVADSNYFANLNVKIERIDAFASGSIVDTIHLNKVDLAAEGYTKQPGTFFTAPNYAYKFKNTLDPNYTYRLIITNLSTGAVDSAETPIIDDVNSLAVPLLDNAGATIEFSSTLPNSNFEFTANYTNPVGNFNFNGASSPVSIAQAVVTFNWVDTNTLTGTSATRSYAFNAGYGYPVNNTVDFKIDDVALYDAVASGIGAAPANTKRILLPCTLAMYLSTPDFNTYLQLTGTQGTGLTASEIEPVYTNIKGADAVGLYTSRAVRTGTALLSVATLDSLQLNPLTSSANIAGQR